MAKFPQLQINCTQGYYLDFEDPEWEKICAETWGDGVGVTLQQMQHVSAIIDKNGDEALGYNNQNLRIVDLRYFNNLSDNMFRDNINTFRNCPNLEKIIIGSVHSVSPNYLRISGSQKLLTVIIGNARSLTGSAGGGNQTVETYAVRYYAGTAQGVGNYFTRGMAAINHFYFGCTTPYDMRMGYGDNMNVIKNLYVPIGTANEYKQLTNWSQIADRIHEYDFDNDPDGIFDDLAY